MLEILGLIALTRWIANQGRTKGYTGWLGAIGPLLWIGFEFAGALVGELMGLGMGTYAVALVCALFGGALAAGVAFALPNRNREEAVGAVGSGTGLGEHRANPWAA